MAGSAWQGAARHGTARLGSAGQGRQGKAGRGKAWHGVAGKAQKHQTTKGATKMKYQAAKGAMFGNKKAQIYGEYLETMMQGDLGVTPEEVVKDAKRKKSPLHDAFTWDDSVAANLHRLQQARQLINHIEIVIASEGDGEPIVRQAAVSIAHVGEDGEESRRSYVATIRVGANENMRQQVLDQARREIIHWKVRYSQYKELASIVAAIEADENKVEEAGA